MSEEIVSALTDTEKQLVSEYAKLMGISLDEALKMALFENIKSKLSLNKNGSIKPLKRP